MKSKEVLVIGAGIAGCAVALGLAKRGIPVTVVTSLFDQRMYHAAFIKIENLEEKLNDLKRISGQVGCMKAAEQMISLARKSLDELLESHLLIDRYGNIDVHRCLQEQLKRISHVEWAENHSVIELLTLESHSIKQADMYKKAACIGVHAYNYETQQVERILAKEIILATGGSASLFPYSTHTATAKGSGFAMAYRAGARLLNMEQMRFHPLALFGKDKPCIPLPINLLKEGGKLQTSKNVALEDLPEGDDLSIRLYEELLKSRSEHLWLDLTQLDPIALKDKYPLVDAYCLNYGFNIAKDLIPIVPATQYTCGGVAVDKAGQTNVQRLRAVGEVACTGLIYDFKDEALSALESLTWAIACAEDIAKNIQKFIYYFPELRPLTFSVHSGSLIVQEDFYFLQKIMWHYVGIIRDYPRLKRAYALLQKLKSQNDLEEDGSFSIEKMHLNHALQTALLVAKAACERCCSQVSRENF